MYGLISLQSKGGYLAADIFWQDKFTSKVSSSEFRIKCQDVKSKKGPKGPF